MARKGFRTAGFLAAFLFSTWSGDAAAAEIATVAKTGDLAPQGFGATFSGILFVPVVNGAGEVAFVGS